MNPLLILTLLLLFVGCERKIDETDERERLSNYKCSADKLESVDRLFNTCNKSTYISTACYLQAMKSFCEYVGPTEARKGGVQ